MDCLVNLEITFPKVFFDLAFRNARGVFVTDDVPYLVESCIQLSCINRDGQAQKFELFMGGYLAPLQSFLHRRHQTWRRRQVHLDSVASI